MKFSRARFIIYVTQVFSLGEFSRELVGNLVDYALQNKVHTQDEVCYFLSDMLPEITFEEVAMFCDDSILTEYGREMKKRGTDACKNTDSYLTAIRYASPEV